MGILHCVQNDKVGVQNDKVGVRGDGFGERLPRLRFAMTVGLAMIGEIATAAPRNDKRVFAMTVGGLAMIGEIATLTLAMTVGIATAAPRNDKNYREGLGVRFVRGTAGRFQNERGERWDE